MTVKNHFLKPLGSEDEEAAGLALDVEALVAEAGTLDAGAPVADGGVPCVEPVSSESMNTLIYLPR